jgi:hypothetical protein
MHGPGENSQQNLQQKNLLRFDLVYMGPYWTPRLRNQRQLFLISTPSSSSVSFSLSLSLSLSDFFVFFFVVCFVVDSKGQHAKEAQEAREKGRQEKRGSNR